MLALADLPELMNSEVPNVETDRIRGLGAGGDSMQTQLTGLRRTVRRYSRTKQR